MNVTWVSLLSGHPNADRDRGNTVCRWSANARQVRAVYWRPPVWSSTPLVVEDHSSSGGFQRPTPPAILNRYLDLGEAIVTKTLGFRLAKPWRKAILVAAWLSLYKPFGKIKPTGRVRYATGEYHR
ncbi:hypothetical protein [Nonomuraea sp. 10N515B]|uniref:hypothetical protein n=1 Tax=Nonomuraea sp. 10N515B TaxID=3457422 RepID=UPI003FCC4A17